MQLLNEMPAKFKNDPFCPSSVNLLLTSNFLEKMEVEYSQDRKTGRFSIKNGPDHLEIDFDYK